MTAAHRDTPDDHRVLVAIDESAYTESVCRHAAWAAERLSASLDIVHVLQRNNSVPTLDLSGHLVLGEQDALLRELSDLDEKRGRLAQTRGRALLQQARQWASDDAGRDVAVHLRHGSLVDTLLDLERAARLLVLGKRGMHADFATGHLGSQVERIARAVHRPMLVASRAFKPIQRVLVAFDGSEAARKNMVMLAASALVHGLDLHIVVVDEAEKAGAALEWAGRTLSTLSPAASLHRMAGQPEEAIGACLLAERIDLLVMGAYGHSRIRQWMVGSTTTAMLRACPIPVLLLR